MLLFICAAAIEAQLFPPFQSFRVIKTEHFDIIFPEESELSARLLAVYADSVYEELVSIFGIRVPVRIPVTFAPHTDMFNGYYNPVASPHIVLFDTPMDPEWTTYEDNLKGLFIHELVHAISLNSRSSFFRVVRSIFGNWATPTFLNAPAFMVEGVTISLESLGGFGRANDPRVKQTLRQAIYEDKFQTPFQASGVYDYAGQQYLFYEYGGLFSAWLQQQYGMEKYAQLWRVMGRDFHFSFFVYRSGFYRIFRNVYNMNFLDAWDAFRDSLAINNIEEAPDEIFPVQQRFFSENRNSYTALAAADNRIFILDRTEEKIRIYNTLTGDIRAFNTGVIGSSDLDVSADGSSVLVSGYHASGDRYRAVVTEHYTNTGRSTGRSIQGLYKARYFRNGVIGIASELHNNNIVYQDFDGNIEVLFRGNEQLMFSGPQVINDDTFAFIAVRGGIRELFIYNYANNGLYRVEFLSDYSENQQEHIWRYMRSLNVSEGKIYFSHNYDDRMYKLAFIDLENMQLVLSGRDFSGGVANPVAVNGSVYYLANFFSGSGVMRFPEPASSVSGTRIDIVLTPVMEIAPEHPLKTELPFFETRRYSPISYMNPFNFWLPLLLFRTDSDSNISFDGGGIFTVLTDPSDRHLIMTAVYYDAPYRMAMVDSFLWQNTVPGFPLTLEFSDLVITETSFEPYRDTRATVNASFFQIPGRMIFGLSFGIGYFQIAENNGQASAYLWERTWSAFLYHASFSFSNIMSGSNGMFGTGMSLRLRGSSAVRNFQSFSDDFYPRFEGRFQASAETQFPLRLVLYGAYDAHKMNLHGSSRVYGQSIFSDSASVEYTLYRGLNLTWLAGAEATLGIFSFEIQNNVSHIYFNRFFGTISARNVLYNSNNHPNAEGMELNHLHLAQSLVLKLGLTNSVIPIKMSPFLFEFNIWGAWKYSNTITGRGKPFNFGLGFNFVI